MLFVLGVACCLNVRVPRRCLVSCFNVRFRVCFGWCGRNTLGPSQGADESDGFDSDAELSRLEQEVLAVTSAMQATVPTRDYMTTCAVNLVGDDDDDDVVLVNVVCRSKGIRVQTSGRTCAVASLRVPYCLSVCLGCMCVRLGVFLCAWLVAWSVG